MRADSIVVGLSGTIASGKSTVSRMLERCGALVINADTVGHKLLSRGEVGWGRVVGNFGTGVLNSRRDVDRSKLAMCVFSNETALKRLNRLLHPPMVERIEREINSARGRGAKLIVVEAAVLFEMGMQKTTDEVWVTYADRKTILRRLTERGMTVHEAHARVCSQISPNEFMRMADRVIICSRNMLETANAVRAAVKYALCCRHARMRCKRGG